jgi:hypothetical protein
MDQYGCEPTKLQTGGKIVMEVIIFKYILSPELCLLSITDLVPALGKTVSFASCNKNILLEIQGPSFAKKILKP